MTKRNVSLYFATGIQRPFNPEEFINEQYRENVHFSQNNDMYYCFQSHTTRISWADFFESITHATISEEQVLSSKHYGIIFIITQQNNLFAITFGTANHKLNKSRFVYNFGLKTTLNMLNPSCVIYRHSSKSISETKTQKNIGSSKALQIDKLNFNRLSDLLNNVNGELASQYQALFGCKKIQGGQSLNISLDSEHLSQQLDSLELSFNSTVYKDKFEFIDNISPILRNERELCEDLDNLIFDKVRTDDFAIFAPIEELQAIDSFQFARQTIELENDTFKGIINGFLEHDDEVNRVQLINFLKHRNIKINLHSMTGGNYSIYKKLYEFLSIDIDFEGQKFLLEQGTWFRISQDLTQSLDDFIQEHTMPCPVEFTTVPTLPNGHLQEEKDYLKNLSQEHPEYILGDRKLVNKIEVFDLFKENRMYHVKKGTSGSAPLSHLFSQGFVAIDRLKTEAKFYNNVQRKFPSLKIDKENLEVAYGVIRNTERLPIFSKIIFKLHAESIEQRTGKEAHIFFIPCEE